MDAAARARAEQLRRSKVMQDTIRTYGTPPDAERQLTHQVEEPQGDGPDSAGHAEGS